MIYIQQMKEKYKLIRIYIGTILLGVAAALILPLLVIPFYPEEVKYIGNFLIPAFLAAFIGIALRIKSKKVKEQFLTVQEGGIIVIFSWILAIMISALPFIFSRQLNFIQALFESVSGWTTTGLSVVDVTQTPKVFLLWRSIMQFFGGAGLAVIMLSAIIGPSAGGMYNAEGRSDRLLPNVTKSTKMIMSIYSSFILAGIILYVAAGMPVFDAVNHSFAALSTGGFSTKANSIGAYNSLSIELITIVLMLLGTTNFAAHYLLIKGNIKKFFRIGEVKFILFLVSFIIPIISFLSLSQLYNSAGKGLRVGAFEIVSAISTTGFSTVSYLNWSAFAIAFMLILMLIGGGTGSTAGGIKAYRIYILIKSLFWNIKSYFLPKKAVREEYVYRPEGKYYVNTEHVNNTSNYVILYLLTFIIGVFIFLFHGYSLQDSLFEFASSIGTVGLSVGITSPTAPVPILITQIFGMILGRLEFFVIFYGVIKIIKDLKVLKKRIK